jgi:predicted nucleic acid-binding protein
VDYLVDTNVLLRALANPNPHKLAARNAIETLLQRDADLCVTPQNLIEFWGVCTGWRNKTGSVNLSRSQTATAALQNHF